MITVSAPLRTSFLTLAVTLLIGLPSLAGVGSAASVGFAWHLSVVEPDVLLYGSTALALDSTGSPVIAFVIAGAGVRLARPTPSGWQIEGIPGSSGAFGMVSLALGPSDRPILSFFDAQVGEVKFAEFDGVAWRVASIDRAHFEGYTSVALNRTGVPHLAYPAPSGDLRHAYRSSSIWFTEDADPVVVTARFPSIAFDLSERPQIAFYGNGNLQFAHWTGFRWTTEVVDTGSNPQSVSLAIGPAGVPMIGYRSEEGQDLRLATWNGTAWNWEVVDSGGDTGWDVRLVLDSAGEPHMSYYERISGLFRYAFRSGGEWTIYVVDVAPASGWYSSLALAQDGTPRFAYFSWDEKAVKYAEGGSGFGIRTWPAQSLRPFSARLVGEITSLGSSTAVSTAFEWRKESGPWTRIPGPSLSAPGFFDVALEGLDPETSYEYRAVANVNGTDEYSAAINLTTPAFVRDVFPIEWIAVGAVGAVAAIVILVFWFSRKQKPKGD